MDRLVSTDERSYAVYTSEGWGVPLIWKDRHGCPVVLKMCPGRLWQGHQPAKRKRRRNFGQRTAILIEVLAVSVRFRRRQEHDASRVILAPSPCLRNYVIAQSLGRLVPVVLTISSASSSLDNPPGPTLPSPPIGFRS